MTIEDLNKILQAFDLIEPLIEFADPGQTLPKHFESLALMYSNEGYRSYLIRQYNSAVKSAALRSNSEVDMAFGKAQALILKKLLIDAKNAFEHADRLKKIREKHAQENNSSQA